MDDTPVQKPNTTWELIRWIVYEPELLRAYSETIQPPLERLRAMARPYIIFTIGALVLYVLGIAAVAFLNVPGAHPEWFKKDILEGWSANVEKNLFLYFSLTYLKFLRIVAVAIVIGLTFGLQSGLTYGLAIGMSLCFALGLAHGLAIGMALGMAKGLLTGISFGFPFGLTVILIVEFTSGWLFGLSVGVLLVLFVAWKVESLSYGLLVGLPLAVVFSIFYYRLPWLAWYSIRSFFEKYNLAKNPHWRDGAIGFPILRLSQSLCRQAFEDPPAGFAFGNFLFQRRKYQRRLAFLVKLAAAAGSWRQQRLDPEALAVFPAIDPGEFKYAYTESWYARLETTRAALADYYKQSNIQLRLRYFRAFSRELDQLYEITLRQPHQWKGYFEKALELWQKSAHDKRFALEQEAHNAEPIAPNIYRGGEKLTPDDRDIFLGRDDLRDTFRNRVLTAPQMPLFFIQGQRRTGKSSLIAFLPELLDRGFAVVEYTMQERSGVPFGQCLQQVRNRLFETLLHEKAPSNAYPEPWLDAWHALRHELEELATRVNKKIVLAIDEYEEFHHILQQDPQQGGQVLGAMRSFSQSQNRVVFLFAGADFMLELKNPNWAEYFTHTERLLVTYLNREDSFTLIRLVDLHYPEALLERMYQETQGHPCLLQKICREIVSIANKEGRESRNIGAADYEQAVRHAVLQQDDGVINIFWTQFCQNRGLKNTIRHILRGETPKDPVGLITLEDHGFILQDAEGRYRLRVPLFEQWLQRYEAF